MSWTNYRVEYTDYNTCATSVIDTVDAPGGYTATNYISDCYRNADYEYCDYLTELLEHGDIELCENED